MKKILLVALLILTTTACISKQVRRGQRLFAGCPQGVDDKATLRSGEFVCKGAPDPAPFGGNGRSCGSCHVPGDRFGISVTRIATLPPTHPFLFPGLDEDLVLLRSHGLVHVVDADEDGLNEFRQTPKLVQLQTLCGAFGHYGICETLGLLGDREKDLCQFSREAVANHMAKTVARVPGVDFRVPTSDECDDLIAYMLSDLVADVEDRLEDAK
jgi:hypothetical protein